MSFKGFQKAIVRAPQTFRQKMNIGESTSDPVYTDAERRFKELEAETKSLSEESKRYHKAVNDMLDHQLGFSKAIEEIYKPISGRMSDPNSAIPEGNPEGIEACEQYADVVNELKDVLKPDLELIDSRIIQPSQELLKIIQSIRKMATKRAHKQLDLDRHQNNLTKHQSKKERTAKDEEKIYKYEADVAVAQQEYDYYNEMLKTELPILFRLEGEFIKPLFISLYYMQLNVFYTLSSRMEEMKIPYFDLSTDIIEAYNFKRGNIEEQVDSIGITNFKLGHAKSKLDATRRRFEMQQNGYGGVAPVSPTTDSASSTYSGGYGQTPPTTASTYGQPAAPAYGDQKTPAYGQPAAPAYGQPAAPAYGQPAAAPPVYGDQKTAAYGQPATPAYGQPAAPVYGQPAAPTYGAASPTYGASSPTYGAISPTTSAFGGASPAAYVSPVAAAAPGYGIGAAIGAAIGSPSPAPAPVPVAPVAPVAEMCTALYDYTAQAAGDLSFKAGQQITIVQRTGDQNGWWTGSCNGLTGVFPGNYVQLN